MFIVNSSIQNIQNKQWSWEEKGRIELNVCTKVEIYLLKIVAFLEIIEIGGFWTDWDNAGKFVPLSPRGKYEKLGWWKIVWTSGHEKREQQCRQCT